MTTLIGMGLTKSYRRRRVLQNIDVAINGGDVLGIVGPNGSGKSTLARILAGVLRPERGSVELTLNNTVIPIADLPYHVGMVAPYLQIYDEFSPQELLDLQQRLHGDALTPERSALTLQTVGLVDRQDDPVRTFSSGLRQRMLIALAVHRQPAVLILDEPTVTLDDAGVQIVQRQIEAQTARGGITLLATNDEREKSWCTTTIVVG